MPKRLSARQIDHAQREGYVFPVPVLTPEKAAFYRDRFEAYERETGQSAPNHLKVKPHLLFTWMMEMATTPALLDAIEDLIGPDAWWRFRALPSITLITGARNQLWHRDSIDRMHEWLTRGKSQNGQVQKWVLTEYAHQDLLWGIDSERDVYPKVVARLGAAVPGSAQRGA